MGTAPRQRRAPSVLVGAGRAPRLAGLLARSALAPGRCPALPAAASGVSGAGATRSSRAGGALVLPSSGRRSRGLRLPARRCASRRRWLASPARWESLSLFLRAIIVNVLYLVLTSWKVRVGVTLYFFFFSTGTERHIFG